MSLLEQAQAIESKVTKLKNKPIFMKAEGAEVILSDMAQLMIGIVSRVENHEAELEAAYTLHMNRVINQGVENGKA